MTITAPRTRRPGFLLFAALLTTTVITSGCGIGNWSPADAQATKSASMPMPAFSQFSGDSSSTTTQAATAPVLDVKTANGAITITKADDAQITITANVKARTQERADAVKILTNLNAGVLEVRAEWPGERFGNEGCSFEISMPAAAGIRADTSNGRIELTGLSGDATLDSSNGAITVTRHAGPIDADTSNGSIKIMDAVDAVKAKTSNGRIVFSLAPAHSGNFVATTSNGTIEGELPANFAGIVQASTSNGSVKAVGSRGQVMMSGGKNMNWVSPSSDEKRSLLTLETSNGSINVRLTP
jgi:DUF4097 and DUF4098 domain-containing protein YvlB